MGKLSVTGRRWLLIVHLLFAAIMLGTAVIFLVLSIIAATTPDVDIIRSCYTVMRMFADSSVRASTIGTLATGILLSVLTKWGLLRYYWIIAKETLSLAAVLLGPVGMHFWSLRAVTLLQAGGGQALHSQAFVVNSGQLWTGIVLQIVSLVSIYIISVFKPWGVRQRQSPVKSV